MPPFSSNLAPEPVPAAVARIAAAMSEFPAQWCLCGGWAIDAWLGRQTREHGDIDISVSHDDQDALLHYLGDWGLIAHDALQPDADDLWDGRELVSPAHVHTGLDPDTVRAWVTDPRSRPQNEALRLEIVLDIRSGGDWVLRPDPRIAVSLDRAIARSPWGLLTAAPEVLLFYKATAYYGQKGLWKRPIDDADFLVMLPELAVEQRGWLRKAIALVLPDHPWLKQLSG